MRNAAFIDTAQDPILTMLSIGVEKQFKLALGLLNVEDNGEWLPSKRLKDEYGHDLIKMDRVLRKKSIAVLKMQLTAHMWKKH